MYIYLFIFVCCFLLHLQLDIVVVMFVVVVDAINRFILASLRCLTLHINCILFLKPGNKLFHL